MNVPNLETTTNALPKNVLRGWIIIVIAMIVSFGLYEILPYDDNANKGLSLLLFIAILWLTEALHITITALLIPVLAVAIGMPSDTGGEIAPLTTSTALSTFADPVIFLFFGGFALATALHVQKLDRKIAMWIISMSGGQSRYCGAGDLCSDGTAFYVDFQHGNGCHDVAFGVGSVIAL